MQALSAYRVWEQNKSDFEALADYMQHALQPLRLCGAVVFGSALREEYTDGGHSDIDIVAYSETFSRETAESCIDDLLRVGGNFFDKAPLFLEDFISPRIEYYIEFGNTKFDINIFPMELGGYQNRYTNATHDSLDIVVGAMYLEGALLYGTIPFEPLIQKEFLPFYSDTLRSARMMQLKQRLWGELAKMQRMTSVDQGNMLYQVFKVRKYLTKWMFMNARKYPIDAERYLKRQFTEELGLSEEHANVLLLHGDSFLQAYRAFIDLALKILSSENE